MKAPRAGDNVLITRQDTQFCGYIGLVHRQSGEDFYVSVQHEGSEIMLHVYRGELEPVGSIH